MNIGNYFVFESYNFQIVKIYLVYSSCSLLGSET